MPKTIPSREVARRCLRRIKRWQVVPEFAEQERDWTFFTSAFPEYEMRLDEIMRGLAILEATGYIHLEIPRPSDPECFKIKYLGEAAA